MPNPKCSTLLRGLLLLSWMGALCAQTISIAPERASARYEPGETVRWQVTVTEPTKLSNPTYSLLAGDLNEIASGNLTLNDGKATISTTETDFAGSLFLEVKGTNPSNVELTAHGGALIAMESIAPADEPPEDFNAFWDGKLAELAAVPINAVGEPENSGRTDVDYATVTLDCIGGQVQGQLARPTAGDTFPALLIVQWAGVYSLQKSWATGRAAEGWLVLNTQAHDITPIAPTSYYEELDSGALSNYARIGNEDRETSYFLRMYLACHRAAEYLANRPDWDGRTLVVMGASQGGMQALITAALHPKITAALAEVPAGCDGAGLSVGRKPAWPVWEWYAWDRDVEKVKTAGTYYDVTHFVPRITCPVLVGVGVLDDVVPAPGVVATYNELRGARELVVMPTSGHSDNHPEYQAAQTRWLQAAKAHQPPVITRAPAPVTASEGEAVYFSVAAESGEPLGYQWLKDGAVIAGATGDTFPIGSVAASDVGHYSVRVSSPGGSVVSDPVALTMTTSPAAGDGPHLANLSTRCFVGTGSAVGVAGFVLDRPATVLIRGIGPSLTGFGVAGALQRPVLRLFDAEGQQVGENVGWKSEAGSVAELSAAMERLGAFIPSSDDDAILRVTLPAGLYSAQVSGMAGSTGNALIEVYGDPAVGDPASDDFVNLSSRCYVGTGSSETVAGLVLRERSTVVIRAVGPTLGAFGVQGVLRNPILTLYDGDSRVVARSVGWSRAPSAAQTALEGRTQRLGGFALQSRDDSALAITLPAGPYTAVISGVNGLVGNGLVEIYLDR